MAGVNPDGETHLAIAPSGPCTAFPFIRIRERTRNNIRSDLDVNGDLPALPQLIIRFGGQDLCLGFGFSDESVRLIIYVYVDMP